MREGNQKPGSKSKEAKGAVPNLDNELNIPEDLKLIIDDSDDEFPIRFQHHNELIDIFSALEENNLLEIIRMQESEQELEQKKSQLKKCQDNFATKISQLKENEEINLQRIQKTRDETLQLQGFTEDSEGLGLDPFTRERIDEETKKLYKVAKNF